MDNARAKFVTTVLVAAIFSLIGITLIWGFSGLGIFFAELILSVVLVSIYTLIRDALNKE